MITNLQYIKETRAKLRKQHPIKYHPIVMFIGDVYIGLLITVWLLIDGIVSLFD